MRFSTSRIVHEEGIDRSGDPDTAENGGVHQRDFVEVEVMR